MRNILLFSLSLIILVFLFCKDDSYFYEVKKEDEIAKQEGYASFYMSSMVASVSMDESDDFLMPAENVTTSIRAVNKNDPRLVGDIFYSGKSNANGTLNLFSINKNITVDEHLEVFCIPSVEYHNIYTYVSISSENDSYTMLDNKNSDTYLSIPFILIPKKNACSC